MQVAADLSEADGHLAHSRLMAVSGQSADDLGFSAAEYLAHVIGVRDIGYQVTPIEAASRLVKL